MLPERDDPRDREYWSWFVALIFLLIPVDILTTTFAVAEYGLAGEQNWFMVLLLQSKWYVFVFVNLSVAVLTIGFFYGVLEMGRHTPDHLQSKYYFVMELWIGILLSLGLAVFANNVFTIIWGQSLFSLI